MSLPTRPGPGSRWLDPDQLAALEDQRDFLLRSLADLEREHQEGDVDEHDYAELKDDYTARAARVIRAIEAQRLKVGVALVPRKRRRAMLVASAVVAFAVLAGVVLAQAMGRRDPGDSVTGDVRQTTRERLGEALTLASDGRYDEAIEVYDTVLADQPGNVEAATYKGWSQFLSGDESGIVTLIDAVETDPDYPDVHAFLAIAFARLGRTDTALKELDRLEALDPPPAIAELVRGLREELEASGSTGPPAPAGETAPTATTAATTSTTIIAPGPPNTIVG